MSQTLNKPQTVEIIYTTIDDSGLHLFTTLAIMVLYVFFPLYILVWIKKETCFTDRSNYELQLNLSYFSYLCMICITLCAICVYNFVLFVYLSYVLVGESVPQSIFFLTFNCITTLHLGFFKKMEIISNGACNSF